TPLIGRPTRTWCASRSASRAMRARRDKDHAWGVPIGCVTASPAERGGQGEAERTERGLAAALVSALTAWACGLGTSPGGRGVQRAARETPVIGNMSGTRLLSNEPRP